ncbi:hypothetical protein EOA37_31730, partial [Mesorhizobium sp. M2A.F.Ca.ET.015.02.1.1]|uniref:hypothetical protein n=1 Tax=Mesorhizobium sp. M2A.F.Ca.ET.015.02.1.1 TaxID=2496758 RepID=UPI000FD354E8
MWLYLLKRIVLAITIVVIAVTLVFLDAAYSGQAEVATGTIAPGLVGHRDKALVPPEGDVEKAKEF